MSCFSKIWEKSPEFQSLDRAVGSFELPCGVTGLAQIHKAHLIHSLCSEQNSRALIVTPDEASAVRFMEDMNTLSGGGALYYPPRDFIFRNVEGQSREYEHLRLGVLSKMMNGEYSAVVCSVDAALQLTMPPSELYRRTMTVKAGQELTPQAAVKALLLAGYIRAEQVDGTSQFALRGGILDFFPPDQALPIRMEFWGDTVDTIAAFDIATQRRQEERQEVQITPAKEVLFDSPEALIARIERHAAALKGKAVRARESLFRDVDHIRESGYLSATDRYLPLAYEEKSTVFDYAADALLFISETAKVKERCRNIQAQMHEEMKSLFEDGILCQGLDTFQLDFTGLTSIYENNGAIYLDNFPRGSFDTPVKHLSSFQPQQLSVWSGSLEQIREDLSPVQRDGYTAVVMAGTQKAAKSLAYDLNGMGYRAACFEEGFPETFVKGGVSVLVGTLSAGFQYNDLNFLLITHGHVTSAKKRPYGTAKKKSEQIHSLEELHRGDYIVHVGHGIGVFDGISSLDVSGVTKDYIKIKYAKEDVLYVPVTQLDLVSKYIGPKDDNARVKVNRLGGAEWQKTRSRVRAAVKDMAKELTRLYAQRMSTQGHAFLEDTDVQRDFEQRFEYEETEDQLRSIEEIKADMERTAPMDRLLCGDVGFGKTEVALRAAFKCISEGKQCAMLVPTTLLAMQHFATITRRMEAYPVEVDMISRFRTPQQQKATLAGLRSGAVDMIVGTHRLISKDIKFHDLGLLIVDEEQRFGVAQKEKLKEKFPTVDVLTLSATPIPRTLNMAMSGIRDMSLLEEAPQDRHPVQTYVIEHDMGILVEAMQKELARGGQCYYLHNYVENIEGAALRIQQMIPESRVGVAHGKMTQDQLSEIWRQLLENEIDILVCTTIIETGVDVPNCNTLIIEDADRMGLAQLHQIRGRVGRSNRRASAYFTFRRGKALSDIATRRLAAIREYTEFGSGFKIAMRDLEIRGAGNVLGSQQHGHMEAVGYDMYLKLLGDAVKEAQGEKIQEEEKECLIDLPVSAHIPETYISSTPQRLAIYRRIAEIRNNDDVSDVYDELIDRFGEPPASVQGLVEIALLRNMAIQCGIYEVGGKGGSLLLYCNGVDMKMVGALAGKLRGRVLVSAGSKPYIAVRQKQGEEPLDTLREALNLMLQFVTEGAR